MSGFRLLLISFILMLSACASKEPIQPPTIADLQGQRSELEPLVDFNAEPQEVIDSYQALIDILTENTDDGDVLRRLADLELEASLDKKAADEAELQQLGEQESLSAIERYQAYLKRYPTRIDNDQVLYQLSRAYAMDSKDTQAQQILDQIVEEYPESRYMDEVQFRRGENLFVLGDFVGAEQAYGDVVKRFPESQFYDKALYKYGWCQFKQNRNRDALDSFLQLLDIHARNGKIDQSRINSQVSRAEQELIGDVIRVVSLAFSYEFENMGIPEFFSLYGNRPYEPMLYLSLAELYIKQERITDATNTYLGYVKQYPSSPITPELHQKAIDLFREAGYEDELLEQKIAFVNNFDVDTEFWHRQTERWRREFKPTLKQHFRDLASHFHAKARESKKTADYNLSADWYRRYLKSFRYEKDTAEMNFLYAENLNEAGRISDAINEYERTAYRYSKHKDSAESGYAALLSYTVLEKSSSGEQKAELTLRRIASALRFSEKFSDDKRVPLVLLQTAEHFFGEKQYQEASDIATRLAEHELADRKSRQSAWSIVAHSQFASSQFALAEKSYLKLLELTPPNSQLTRETRELVAASIYRQGEAARNSGNQLLAAEQFMRLGKVIPESPKRRVAEYDAATAYIELQKWPEAIKLLETFRQRYPNEKQLSPGVTEKLALAYNKNGNQANAAAEMMTLSTSAPQDRKRELMWTAAGLYEEAGESQKAVSVYKQYISAFPQPLDRAVELRHRIAEYYGERNDRKNRNIWLKQIVDADARGNNQRTERTRYLAATASMELVQPVRRAFEQVKLTVPLKNSLRKKKKLMEQSIDAYTNALKYQVAEVTTEATYRIGEIYHHFATALLNSQRPKGLDEEALEEYDLLLEEQAYPFEEKAIDIHTTNFKRIPTGTYDESVKNSLRVLGKLMPFRYAREEISSTYVEVAQ